MTDHVGDDDDLLEGSGTPDTPSPGVDVLSPSASTVVRRDPRERIRSSRLGQLAVLLVTAAVVVAGWQIVRMQGEQDRASQTGGATVVRLDGTSRVPPPALGQPATDFTYTTWDGQEITLSDLRGKGVWITFGATWCTNCQAEMPDVEAASRAWADRGVAVLGINIQEDQAAVSSYAERTGLTMPIGLDPTNEVAGAYAVGAIPAHYFIDPEGIVRDIRVGGLSRDTMDSILGELAP